MLTSKKMGMCRITFLLVAMLSVFSAASASTQSLDPVELIASSDEILIGRFLTNSDGVRFEVERSLKGSVGDSSVVPVTISRPRSVFNFKRFIERLPGTKAQIFGTFSQEDDRSLVVPVFGIWPHGSFGPFASNEEDSLKFSEAYTSSVLTLLGREGNALLSVIANTDRLPKHFAALTYLTNNDFRLAEVDHELAITIVFERLRDVRDEWVQKYLIAISPRVPAPLSLPWLRSVGESESAWSGQAKRELVAYFRTRRLIAPEVNELEEPEIKNLIESEVKRNGRTAAELAFRGVQLEIPSIRRSMRHLLASILNVELRSLDGMSDSEEAEFWRSRINDL